jgi:hypothetical protein
MKEPSLWCCWSHPPKKDHRRSRGGNASTWYFPPHSCNGSFVNLRRFCVGFAQTFAKKQKLFTGPSPYGIKTVDVNNDGKLDLIWISSEHNIEVRLGHGDGTFATSRPIYDTKLRSSATFLRDAEEFEVADLNHDKKPDIVVAGGHTHFDSARERRRHFSIAAAVRSSFFQFSRCCRFAGSR